MKPQEGQKAMRMSPVGQAFGTYQFLINERGRMMKKLLLGSTALVAGGLMAAPAMAADPIKIGLGGYYQFFVNAGAIESVYALNGNSMNPLKPYWENVKDLAQDVADLPGRLDREIRRLYSPF